MTARRRERGSAALELPLIIGLVLIPLGLLVLHVPVWIEHQHAARQAAAEAARVVVTSTTGDPEVEARFVVADVEAAHGLAPGSLRLRLDIGPSDVVALVTVRIPAARLPGLGALPAVDWTASHRERRPDLGQRLP